MTAWYVCMPQPFWRMQGARRHEVGTEGCYLFVTTSWEPWLMGIFPPFVIEQSKSANSSRDRQFAGSCARDASSNPGRIVRPRTRADQLVVRGNGMGDAVKSLACARDAQSKASALQSLESEVYAASSQAPQQTLLRTWAKFHNSWFANTKDVYPISVDFLRAVAAMFKAGGYASFKNYLCAVKAHHIRLGHDWGQALDKAGKDATRSVLRGLGPAKRSDPLVLHLALVVAKSWGHNFARADRPIDAAAMIICGVYFMTREIEFSGAIQHELTILPDASSCQLLLPVSKKDPNACGVVGTVECMCDLLPVCPSCYLQGYLERLSRLGKELSIDVDPMPLFPNPVGCALTKRQVNEMVRDIVKGYMPGASNEALSRGSLDTACVLLAQDTIQNLAWTL